MKKIGLIYGSATGNTQNVVSQLANILGENNLDIKEVSQTSSEEISSYDKLIFASSTWGAGDLQSDWEDFETQLDSVNFSGKTVALLGLGDQKRFGDTFCEAISLLHDKVKDANIIGQTSTNSYNFQDSNSVVDGEFLGLAIDEDNQENLTKERLESWVEQIKGPFKL
mgnify:CR=1 FL=1